MDQGFGEIGRGFRFLNGLKTVRNSLEGVLRVTSLHQYIQIISYMYKERERNFIIIEIKLINVANFHFDE